MRDDDPPKSTTLIVSRTFHPKKYCGYLDDFPFETSEPTKGFAITQTEIEARIIDRCDKLIQFYQYQLESLPDVTAANIISFNNAALADRRRQVFYSILLAINNSPKQIALKAFSDLYNLRKLWINKRYYNTFVAVPQTKILCKCCKFEDCINPALYGSDFCYWHILNDPNQQMYEKCPNCGQPKLFSTLCKSCSKSKANITIYPIISNGNPPPPPPIKKSIIPTVTPITPVSRTVLPQEQKARSYKQPVHFVSPEKFVLPPASIIHPVNHGDILSGPIYKLKSNRDLTEDERKMIAAAALDFKPRNPN
ncbi:hypothetical protein TVAG_021350 [Trichomonas vaginalis G3]|uniref:KAT8 regulatory NSL complex subunit 2 n=1 Tax=Trichomonas vaginalis (strain ATCC PRA-98 / G3) TaxID=412133 RepID=A2DHB7_TRIV3|nr:KAT8 regulatory NSL complex subunit 2 family [Trichomonas vaginalis G3]EAY20190.1 hypothetical protein TVAG_021350 [Trichomonas vaginalis G3]KAI5507669.1 KAT8 regulatory NSL complex subunit 2 family [Trichomonas vaginalis G3]|eukprot:XP_001581176.1 hypothetical protein [Trichomonas vaginalis G3]